MAWKYPGDNDSEQVGKFIDAGHSGYGLIAYCVRQFRIVVIAAMVIGVAIYVPERIPAIATMIAAR